MKLEEIESYKFRAESLRNFGLAFYSPLGIALIKIIFHEIRYQSLNTYEIIIILILFVIGWSFIDKSAQIMNKLLKADKN
ncbi:MAG: hypothetical protein HRT47_13245 [Candidatus Caenarcaniphilales bacterium]|nr:hypothetical protein [Candidatus Caenarcaniphilales bacterium]